MKSSRGIALKWLAQSLYAVCLAGLLLLPTQRYGWMREFDPTLSTLPEDAAGNRLVAAAALWGAALVAQGLAALWADGTRGRWVALALALLAATVWLLRFGA